MPWATWLVRIIRHSTKIASSWAKRQVLLTRVQTANCEKGRRKPVSLYQIETPFDSSWDDVQSVDSICNELRYSLPATARFFVRYKSWGGFVIKRCIQFAMLSLIVIAFQNCARDNNFAEEDQTSKQSSSNTYSSSNICPDLNVPVSAADEELSILYNNNDYSN